MNKKLILLFILMLAFLYINNVNAELKPIKTYLNVSVISFGSGNETRFNLTIRNEDLPITIDNINQNSNINQNNLIILIRDIDVNQTDISNLTMECLRRVATIDGDSLISCRESKARQFDTIQTLQTENSNLKGIDGNLTMCNTNLRDTQGNLGNCSTTVGILRNDVDSAKNGTTTWVFISVVATALIVYFYFKRKYGGVQSNMESEFGRNTTAEPDIPGRFKDRIENLPNEKID